jgi:hypothetical protein
MLVCLELSAMTHLPSTLVLSWEQLRHARVAASGLLTPFASPEEAAARLAGIQAQIEPAAGIALWNRTQRLTLAEFDACIYTRRTLVKLWGQRGTLHLYAATDWPLLHGARTLNRTWWERQAEDPSAALDDYRHKVEVVAGVLRSRESMGRSDLRALELDLHEELYSGWGGIFADLVRHGYACHAGREGSEGRFAHRERWLPDLPWNPPDPEHANIELARRYFAAYGPATIEDFAYWRGMATGKARAWVAALGAELSSLQAAGLPMLAATAQMETLAALPAGKAAVERLPVRLLFRFDPLLLAHRNKEWVVPAAFYNRVWRPAGHIEGTVLFRGQAVAVWRYERKGSGLVVQVAPFAKLPAPVLKKLPRLAAGVAAFFSLPLADLRFVDGFAAR